MELYELLNILHGVDRGDLELTEGIKAVKSWLSVVDKPKVHKSHCAANPENAMCTCGLE